MKDFTKKYYILIILFICMVVVSVSRVRYYLYGDLSIYYDDYLKLKSGYFADNLLAFFNSSVNHVRFTTEGGWPILIYLSSFIHSELPYFLASLLFSCIFALIAIVLIINTNNYKTSLCGILLLFIMINVSSGLRNPVWMLTNPFRDTASYIFVFLSIICASLILQNIDCEKNGKRIFLCGLSLGFSAWFRAPNIILVVPISVLLVFYFLRNYTFKYCFKMGVVFAFSVLIGLLPLLIQNGFEGRRVIDIGQADLLIHNPVALPQHQNLNPSREEIFALSQNNVVCGLHLQNFKYTFPKTVKTLAKQVYGYKLLCVYLFFVLLGLLRKPKSSLLLIFCSISMLLFYSFYDKFVERYYVAHILFFMMACTLGIIVMFDLIDRFFLKKNLVYLNIAQFVLLGILLLSFNKTYGGYKAIFEQRQLMLNYKNVMGRYVFVDDIVYNTPFTLWTKESLTDSVEYWCWSGNDMIEQYVELSDIRLKKLNRILQEGNKAFVLQPTQYGNFCSNWKINDISLWYDLSFITNIWSNDRFDMSLYQIKNRANRQFAKTLKTNGRDLVLWCEDADRKKIFPVDVNLYIGNVSTNITLHAGYNIFNNINVDTNISNNVVISSSYQPLPGVIIPRFFDKVVSFDFRDYTLAPVFNRTFENSYVEWIGTGTWRRDTLFLKNRRKTLQLFSSILVNQRNDISFSIDQAASSVEISLYVSCVNMQKPYEDMLKGNFVFEVNGEVVEPQVELVQDKKSKTYYNLSFSPSKSSGEPNSTLILSVIPSGNKSMSIYKLSIGYL